MAESANPPRVEHMLYCPTIFFDTVPTVGLRSNVITLALAVHVGEPIAPDETKDHLVAVANLRLPIAAIPQLRGALDKIALLVAPTSGGTN